MRKELTRLIEIDRELGLLGHIGALLGWDQETYMPTKAVDERSEQIALVETLAHEKAVSPEIGDLLAALGSTTAVALGRSLPRRRRERRLPPRPAAGNTTGTTKLPADLVAELARETSLSQAAWIEARATRRLSRLRPPPRADGRAQESGRPPACSGRRGLPRLALRRPPRPLRAGGHRGIDQPRSSACCAGISSRLLGKIASRPQVGRLLPP